MDKALHRVFLLDTCKYRNLNNDWDDVWLNDAISVIREMHMYVNAGDAETTRLGVKIKQFEATINQKLDTFNAAIAPHFKKTHINCPGHAVTWKALRRFKNQAHSDNKTKLEIGSRLWILAAVRGTRNHTIRQNLTDFRNYPGCNASLNKMADVLMCSSVGIADDLLLEHITHEDMYLNRAFDNDRGNFASLRYAWDNEHLDAIESLTSLLDGFHSFNHAMQQVKEKLCASKREEDTAVQMMQVPGVNDLHYVDRSDRSDKGLNAMANTAASAMIAWCRMPDGQTWEDYIEVNNTGRQQEKKELFARVLDDVMKKAPVFRRYKALLIMIEQLLLLRNLFKKAQKANQAKHQKSEVVQPSSSGSAKNELSKEYKVTAAFYHADDDTIQKWIQHERRNSSELARLVLNFKQDKSDTIAAFEDDTEVIAHTTKDEFKDFRTFVGANSRLQNDVWDALSKTLWGDDPLLRLYSCTPKP